MSLERGVDSHALLEALGQAALIFDSSNRLAVANRAAQSLLGVEDLHSIQVHGWSGARAFFDRSMPSSDDSLDMIRSRALESDRPARFTLYRSGQLIPCWAMIVHGNGGEVYTLITLETPDWTTIGELFRRYLQEVNQAVEATGGHADLIQKSLQTSKSSQSVEQIARRVGGFARLIAVHMYRLQSLTDMMARLEAIRTGNVRDMVNADKRKIVLTEFFEDFLETIDETPLVDPETETGGHRERIKTIIPPHLCVLASPHYVALILRDLLRNAIMYSMRGTSITVIGYAGSRESSIQIDVTDEGYGIRASEYDRVFTPFERSRQPQIISEFGYGLSLYLCKHEIEAMNGQLWFETQEGSGTTLSLRLPAYRETTPSSSSE